ncbi:PD-(D/E)XK nuclease family protein [Chromohalobacter beijerinckii]|uniref:PD-(D/E)XK nuclease family protein n=1 Tax=Chromohalobacter beijerinckii TaxID=86179 RepID=A0ABV8XA53_9GAMM|nr:PD-(D/E)XK nuclease family protein [Chromohalobacter beijerinckii]MCK0765815.1 PD-(D/E)XK nuclease family protein [Chromohalobacter beijerinckii]
MSHDVMSSETTDLAALERFFEKLALLPSPEPPTPNLFSEAGPGTNENRLSNLMAFFMGGYPGSPRWLAKAVLHALVRQGGCDHEHLQRIDWEAVTTEREAGSWNAESESTKRLDLVVSGTDFVLGIEHKVWASAENNPFDAYDGFLKSYEAKVYKCVLCPDESKESVRAPATDAGWPTLSYSELLKSAYELYGQDVVPSNQTKWQVFYQELLQHLDAIAHPKEAKTMTPEELDFSLKHFNDLYEASQRLEQLEKELMVEGKNHIATALQIENSEITTNKNPEDWREDQTRVWRFFPKMWRENNGGGSQICLIYYPSSESEGNENIGFEVRVYLESQERNDPWLEEVEQAFLKVTPVTKQLDCTWYRDGYGNDTWPEIAGRWLALSAWPREYTKAGAMTALGDLAKWVDEHAFQTETHTAG